MSHAHTAGCMFDVDLVSHSRSAGKPLSMFSKESRCQLIKPLVWKHVFSGNIHCSWHSQYHLLVSTNVDSISYVVPPPNPPWFSGSCTVRQSWRHSCVLPPPLSPAISVTPRDKIPPSRTWSILEHPVDKRHVTKSSRRPVQMSNTVDGRTRCTDNAAFRLTAATSSKLRLVNRLSSDRDTLRIDSAVKGLIP